ncbi:MAG: recombinase zinc beta ribbon domain-containing protein [Leuconostoc sp.]|nr:recombinase zinc beta ribbon domain-containing protein [Leuconostoc sp.]
MLCQKTYRNDQYHRHFNQGELAQYLIEDHHKGIINHHDFNQVQDRLKQVAQERHIESGNHQYQQHYLFTGKLICDYCGSAFKRQTRPNKICWACQKHLHSAKLCPVRAIPEEWIQNAFCNMMNKLTFSKKFLMLTLAQQLRDNFINDPAGKLSQFAKQIKENDDKAETLNKLLQTGLIDQSLHINQTAELEQSTYQIQQRIKQINNNHTDDANNLEDFREILRWCQQDQFLNAFDPALFQTYVQSIKILNQHEISFQLKCRLSLIEHLVNKQPVSERFYRDVIHHRFNEPVKQAEYLYSTIKSEVDLIG